MFEMIDTQLPYLTFHNVPVLKCHIAPHEYPQLLRV